MEATNAAVNSRGAKLRNFYRDLYRDLRFRVKHLIAQGLRKLKLRAYLSRSADKRALEIGGPSNIFRDEGVLPVYGVVKTADNCLYSHRTIWEGDVSCGADVQIST